MPIPLVRLNAQISRAMPAPQWSRHSCLHFNCRALALDGSNFHGSIVSRRLMTNCATKNLDEKLHNHGAIYLFERQLMHFQ
jgi:hypothetical protein